MGKKFFAKLKPNDVFYVDGLDSIPRKYAGKLAIVHNVNRSRKNRVTVTYEIPGVDEMFRTSINQATGSDLKVQTV